MLITMKSQASTQATDSVIDMLTGRGFEVHAIRATGAAVIGVNGMPIPEDLGPALVQLPGVDHIDSSPNKYPLAARTSRPLGTVVPVGESHIGGPTPAVIAGPCVVETHEQLLTIAERVKEQGATLLRGGAFKPRTSPYSFQGHGELGLEMLADVRERTGLPVVTEVMEPGQVELVAHYADVLQIGSRNMMNFPLLRAVSTIDKPVLLKRGFAATVEEWLQSAEYILAGGNDRVILCERGIRSFDTSTRFALDLNAVPLLRSLTHLPVIVDPSHGTGRRDLVAPMSAAGIAAGAHGLIIEVHPEPDSAMCDGPQSIHIEDLGDIVTKAHAISSLMRVENVVTAAVA
jgi:3-deoxy-7-phosphoheptulonate synthase